jgi:hypothetical protein
MLNSIPLVSAQALHRASNTRHEPPCAGYPMGLPCLLVDLHALNHRDATFLPSAVLVVNLAKGRMKLTLSPEVA